MSTKQKETVPAVKENTLPAEFNLAEMQADSGIGRENMEASDLSLPYVLLLQDLSPQVDKKNAARVDGAESGDIYNNVSQEIWSGETGVEVIPCAFQKAWVEWQPNRGGFVTSDSTDARMNLCSRDDKGYDILPNGNLLVPTYYYYVMLLEGDGTFQFGVIAMARTAMKKGRKWNSLMSSVQVNGPNGMFNPPMCAQKYLLQSEVETKDKNSFYNWKVTAKGLVDSQELYAAAKAFATNVSSGLVKVKAPSDEHVEEKEVF